MRLDPVKGSRVKMPSQPPRVFISYSHDSPEHARRVLGLAERLRKDGVDTQLDQCVAGTPTKGWPRWMLDQLDWAEFVLMVCTETYYRRFRRHQEPGKGKGAEWEGNLITLEVYHAKSRTTKFAPVLFASQDEQFIPEPLSGHTHYVLTSEDNYAKLYDFLTGQAGVTPSELGSLKTLARKPVEPLGFGMLSNLPDRNLISDRVGDKSVEPIEHKIFISYRRDDSSAWAGRLSDRLSNHFASNQIFMDVDLDAGIDFVEAIAENVGSCDVLIAVVGKRWLTATDEDGKRRLDNPDDFVRTEIVTALKRGIRVIPVLVDGASMPRSRDLPDDLKSLARRNALEVSHNRFRADSERLINAVERALEKTTEERSEQKLSGKPITPSAAVTSSPPVIATPSVEKKARSALERATKDHPWVDSLGMKFVPVAGTQVLFSVWDTRVQDFEMFVKSTDYDATGGLRLNRPVTSHYPSVAFSARRELCFGA
jgi:hypothetical protein